MTASGDGSDKAMQAAQPQIDWALATRCIYLGPGAWVPLLVEFRTGSRPADDTTLPLDHFISLQWLPEDLRDPECVRLPSLSFSIDLPQPPPAELSLGCWVIYVHRDRLESVTRSVGWHQIIARAELGAPCDLPKPDQPPAEFAAKAAALEQRSASSNRRLVLGVIDEGIPFAHARFRSASGSRIAHLWQQGIPGSGPAGVGTGRILTAADIDAAFAAASGDEDRVYRAIGGLDYAQPGLKALGRSRSHGAHVLDLAAGADPGDDVLDRPIVAVDMPDGAVGNPSGSLLTPHALLGLVFILRKAQAMRRPNERLPVIVNLSYGPHEGPHDGTSILEVAMDRLISLTAAGPTPMRIVLAAGNARQVRSHAALRLEPKGSRVLEWRLQPGSLAPSRIRIELPRGWPGGVMVTLASPGGGLAAVVHRGAATSDLYAAGKLIAQMSYLTASAGGGAVEITVAPTSQDPAAANWPIAPSGLWRLELTNPSISCPLDLHAWIARSDSPSGRPARGRQSYFDDPDYARFDASGRPWLTDPPGSTSYVRRSSTLSGIATGALTDVVGARGFDDPNPRRYSSAGPHLNPGLVKEAPESLAPGDWSAARRGVLAAGIRSGSVRAMNGTSVAAPQAVRWLADQWLATGALPRLPPSIPWSQPTLVAR